jgi:ribosome-associated protein
VEEKQATDIVLLDVHEQTTIADYFIIATVETDRQAKAVEDDLWKVLQVERKIRPLGKEGTEGNSGGWILLDYGDVILHLFTPEARAYYQLEDLWATANVVVKAI